MSHFETIHFLQNLKNTEEQAWSFLQQTREFNDSFSAVSNVWRDSAQEEIQHRFIQQIQEYSDIVTDCGNIQLEHSTSAGSLFQHVDESLNEAFVQSDQASQVANEAEDELTSTHHNVELSTTSLKNGLTHTLESLSLIERAGTHIRPI